MNAPIKEPSLRDLLIAPDQFRDAERDARAAESAADALCGGLQSIGNLLVIAADTDESRISAADLTGLGYLLSTLGSLLSGVTFLRSEAENCLARGARTYAELVAMRSQDNVSKHRASGAAGDRSGPGSQGVCEVAGGAATRGTGS